MNAERAQEFADAWNQAVALKWTTIQFCAHIGVQPSNVYKRRREVEHALSIDLPTMTGSASVAGRERNKRGIPGLPPLEPTSAQAPIATVKPVAPPDLQSLSAAATPSVHVPAPSTRRGQHARHYIVPDLQLRKGVPMDHLPWIGADIVRRKPDVIVLLGDVWDMPSLSSHDAPGSLALEGARYEDDIRAGNDGLALLMAPIMEAISAEWNPRRIYCEGNHEFRILRAIESDPRYSGIIGPHHCNVERFGFERYNFKQVVEVDGVHYSHFFQMASSDRPIGGSMDNRLNKICGTFVQGHEQGLLQHRRPLPIGRTIHGIVAGSCLTPHHKVLTAELEYVPLGDVEEGDKLVSFDEDVGADGKRSRRYRTGVVEAVKSDYAETFAVILENGKTFEVTADHLWLTRKAGTTTGWLRTDQLVTLDSPRPGATHVPVLLEEWEPGRSYEHGWLSGLYDGEGCLYHRKTAGGSCMQLSLAQLPGRVLDRATDWLSSVLGLEAMTETNQRGVCAMRVKGGAMNIARVLGTLRPTRLISKFVPEMLGRMRLTRWVAVKAILPAGRREIVRIAVDRKTMVVEGYGHHNCYLHSEDYRGPQRNNEWRGVVVLHDVRNHGDCDPMPLTLQYLARTYGGVDLHDLMAEKYPTLPRGWAA